MAVGKGKLMQQMSKRHYRKPIVKPHIVDSCLPLAGSLERPGGQIDDFTWDEGENTGGGGSGNPGGSIEEFEWE